jgi:outer membrane protein assembly factor BamD (BamD/ComL family)
MKDKRRKVVSSFILHPSSFMVLLLLFGCQGVQPKWPGFLTKNGKPDAVADASSSSKDEKGKKENWIFRAGHWEQQSTPPEGTVQGDFAQAKGLFDAEEYAKAEKAFRKVVKQAEKEKNSDLIEDALFMQAESLYAQRKYPKARELYAKLLDNFPSSRHRNDIIQREFHIAEFWLDDTRDYMDRWKDYEEGKGNFPWPAVFNFDREKPFVGTEGAAVKACEAVYTQDPLGTLAPQALYRAGGVNYFRENFNAADDYFSLLVDQYPRSPLTPRALELAIQAKSQVNGGPDYDGRKIAEARALVDTALRSFPEFQRDPEKRDTLERTLMGINEQQAQKDYNVAEFYRRTKKPAPAYFYYEIVRRRYPGTDWADKATERMLEIRDTVEKDK